VSNIGDLGGAWFEDELLETLLPGDAHFSSANVEIPFPSAKSISRNPLCAEHGFYFYDCDFSGRAESLAVELDSSSTLHHSKVLVDIYIYIIINDSFTFIY
jgi:hypothetical protein